MQAFTEFRHNRKDAKHLKKKILIYSLIIIGAIITVSFLIFTTLSPKKPDTDISPDTGADIPIPMSNIISDTIKSEDLRKPSDSFNRIEQINDLEVNVYSKNPYVPLTNGGYVNKSDSEWFLYSSEDTNTLDCYKDTIEHIISQKIADIKQLYQKDGYIGITPGGFSAGSFTVGNKNYYILSYYIQGEQSCGYMTSEERLLNQGLDLLTENILTMVYDISVLEGTGDLETDDVVPYNDPYLEELRSDAQHIDFAPNRSFDKMLLIAASDKMSSANKIYLRRAKDNSIIQEDHTIPHKNDEIMFVVDAVQENEKFQLVVFSSDKIEIDRIGALDYNAVANSISDNIQGND